MGQALSGVVVKPIAGTFGMVSRITEGVKNSANRATLGAVRATYSLSKRTAVYATAGHVSNGGTLALSVSGAQAGGNPPAGRGQTGLAVGMRHAF